MSRRTRLLRAAAARAGAAALLLSLLAAAPASAEVTFAPTPEQATAPDELWAIASGDVDGDGRPDLLVPTHNVTASNPSFSMLRTGADGAPGAAASQPIVSGGSAIATGDFDGDGHLDAVSGGVFGSTLDVLLGRGDGTFAFSSFNSGSGPEGLAAADFDGDGNLDVAVASGGPDVAVFLGDGAGGFSAGPVTEVGVSSRIGAIAADDLDGDGDPDLAAGDCGACNLVILRNAGDGSFATAASFPGYSIWSVRTGDLNGDGRPDVVGVTRFDNELVTVLSTADGGFELLPTAAGGGEPYAVELGDVDLDGVLDAVTIDYNPETLTVNQGRGDGSFGEPQTMPLGGLPHGLVLEDFDRDGKLDVAIAHQTASVQTWLNTSRRTASATPSALDLGSQPVGTLGQPQAVTITNSGTRPLRVDLPAVGGAHAGDFMASAGDCARPLAPRRSCTLTVRFVPGGAGARSATMTVPTSSAGGPLAVALSGTGTALAAGPGAPGPAGQSGPAGPAGAHGANGRDRAVAPLVLVLADRRLTAQAGRRLRVAFAATRAGRATLTVRAGRKTVATARATLRRAGSGTLAIRGLPRGRYRVSLAFVANDGRHRTVAARLVVRR